MGHWNETCAITGTAIYEDEPVVGMLLYADRPLPFFWYGTYDEYGWFKDIDCPMEDDMFDWLRGNMVELSEDDDDARYTMKANDLNWENLGEWGHRGELLAHPRTAFDEWHNRVTEPRIVNYVFIHRSVWDAMVNQRLNPESYKREEMEPFHWDIMYEKAKEELGGGDVVTLEEAARDGDTEAALKLLNRMRLDHTGVVWSWFSSANDMDVNAVNSNVASPYITRNLEHNDLEAAKPYFQWRWFAHIARWMGRKIVKPPHIGRGDPKGLNTLLASMTLQYASRTREGWGTDLGGEY